MEKSKEDEDLEELKKEYDYNVFREEVRNEMSGRIVGDDDIILGQSVESVIVPDEDVLEFPRTTVQYNGRFYSTPIPIDVIKETNIAKGDKLKWKITEKNELILYVERYNELALPLKKRIRGR